MEHPWLDFWNKVGETLGVAILFSFVASAFLLWLSPETYSKRRGFTVIVGGFIVTGAATSFVQGYLGWSIFLAPVIGIMCGLVAVPLLQAIIRVSNDRMGDIVEVVVKKVTGKELP